MDILPAIINELTDLQYAGGRDRHLRAIGLVDILANLGLNLPELHNLRGVSCRMIGKYEEAAHDYRAVLDIGEPESEICRALVNLADYERIAEARFDRAHIMLDQAERHARQNSLETVIVLNQRGLVLTAEEVKNPGLHDTVIATYLDAARISRESLDLVNDRESQKRCGDTFSGLAYTYQKVDPRSSLRFAKGALGYYDHARDLRGKLNTLCNMGRTLRDRNELDSAQRYLESAWQMAYEEKELRPMAAVALDLAELYHRKGSHSSGDYFWSIFTDNAQQQALTDHDHIIMKGQIDRVRSFYNKP